MKALGAHLKGGKLMPREDPEDSQAQPDGGSVKKPADPKKKGKADAAEQEELSPEEEEKLRKEKEERDKLNAQLQEEWNNMTEDEKFYSTAENKAKECFITFPDVPAEGEQEAPTKTCVQEVALETESLKELESQINDPKQGRCTIRVEKLVPQGGEEAAKKAPAKGKAAAPGAEESKPVVGEAYFDFTPFLHPGTLESEQRCFIFTVQEAPASPEDGAEAAAEKAEGEEEPVEEAKPFESRHCYVLIKVSMSEAINP